MPQQYQFISPDEKWLEPVDAEVKVLIHEPEDEESKNRCVNCAHCTYHTIEEHLVEGFKDREIKNSRISSYQFKRNITGCNFSKVVCKCAYDTEDKVYHTFGSTCEQFEPSETFVHPFADIEQNEEVRIQQRIQSAKRISL